MADRYFRGSTGDINTTAAWSSTRYGATGASIPGSSDTAYFYDGNVDIDTNISNFLAATVVIGGNFAGNIGTESSSLEMGTASANVIIERVPKSFVNVSAKASVTIGTIHVKDALRGRINVTSGASGVVTALYCGTTGIVRVDPAVSIPTIKSAGCMIDAPISSNAITELWLSGNAGQSHRIGRSVGTAYLSSTRASLIGTAAVTTKISLFGDTVYFHDSTGTITLIEAADRSKAMAGSVRFTVTNAVEWANGKAFSYSDKVTFTNPPTSIGNSQSGGGAA